MEAKFNNVVLLKCAADLNKTIAELKASQQKLQESYLDTIYRLALVAEYKDETTGMHIARISHYSAFLAERMGLPKKAVQNLLYASPMHDVGKVAIPDSVLLKPAKLTTDEFEIIKAHTIIGAKILADSRSEILNVAQRIALSHHEKWNGTGYPQGLSGEQIPLFSRIVALVDVFNALISRRPYKGPYPLEVACEMIKKERGEHFDPELVDLFLKHINEILKLKTEFDLTSFIPLSTSVIAWSQRDLEEMK